MLAKIGEGLADGSFGVAGGGHQPAPINRLTDSKVEREPNAEGSAFEFTDRTDVKGGNLCSFRLNRVKKK